MINYVLDYLERSGVVFSTSSELTRVTKGVRLYLLENGIPELDKRAYFRRYLDRSLSRVDKHDLKAYFLAYPLVSKANQICIEFSEARKISPGRRQELLYAMSSLYEMGLGEKYIPAIEVKMIIEKQV